MNSRPDSPLDASVVALRLADDGSIPNHPHLPLLLWRRVVDPGNRDPAARLEAIFARHGWVPAWRNGIYPLPHYHSTAHEVLGIARGRVRFRLGGARGVELVVEAGDVVFLPAGVGHQRLERAPDLLVVGATRWDSDPICAAAWAKSVLRPSRASRHCPTRLTLSAAARSSSRIREGWSPPLREARPKTADRLPQPAPLPSILSGAARSPIPSPPAEPIVPDAGPEAKPARRQRARRRSGPAKRSAVQPAGVSAKGPQLSVDNS